MGAWIDLLEDRSNVLGIVGDTERWSLLTSSLPQPRLGIITVTVPPGFERLHAEGIISAPLYTVITRFACACHLGLSSVPTSQQQFPDFSAAVPSLTETTPTFEKCLTLALFCYSRRRWSQQYQVAGMICHTIARTKLMQMLRLLPESNMDAIGEALVWIWLVAASALCLEGSVLNAQGLECLTCFRARMPEHRDWKKVEDILKSFFWRDQDSAVLRKDWH
jgi:hypothetical protein